MILLELFWSFFQIGLFSIGGGYAALPLIQNQVINIHPWLTMGEFADLITIAEMAPGPIALNAATFVGTQVAGLPGALVATLGCVTPPCIIVLTLAYLYTKYQSMPMIQGVLKGLRPAVVALIGAAGISIIILAFFGEGGISAQSFNATAFVLFLLAFVSMKKIKLNPIFIIIGCGVAGGVIYTLFPALTGA